jgi:hypothetical protein
MSDSQIRRGTEPVPSTQLSATDQASIVGDGSGLRPLATVPGGTAVATDTTLSGDGTTGDPLHVVGTPEGQGITLVFRQGSMIPRDNVYNDWDTALTAAASVQGQKFLQIDSTMELEGGTLAFAAGVVTYTSPLGAPAIPVAVVGQQMVVSGAADETNNGSFFVASRPSATQITFANAGGITDGSFAGVVAILGGFVNIIPAAGMPAGGWPLTDVEITASSSPVGPMAPNQQLQLGGAPSGGDVQLVNALKWSGDLTVTNLNTALPANVITAGGVTVEWGTAWTGGTPTLVNNGTAPFWDNSVNSQTLTLLLASRIGGTSPAINAGNANYSPNPTIAFLLKGNARIAANMVIGTNVAAILNIGAFNDGVSWGHQQNWAGNIVQPNTGWVRAFQFPASLLQASPVPSAAPLAFATGMVWNARCLFNTTAADITQQLPQVRAAAPATGAVPGAVSGVLDSLGMVVWIDNALGAHNVIVTPNATTPDTFEDGTTACIVPPGYAFGFMSDGISKIAILTPRNASTGPALLAGPGNLDITRSVTLFTSTLPGNALSLVNGTYKGQTVTVIHSTVGGGGATGVITPATPGGNFASCTLTNHWDWGTFQWDGAHWNVAAAGVGFAGLA